jgi:serine protease Do
MGKSADLIIGQWCVGIGHPGGFQEGRSPVVRLGRVLGKSSSTVRTDCALVGGDSGGPLFDMNGKVIGIHSRIDMAITTNLHVAIDNYQGEHWDKLAKGEVTGGLLGGSPANLPYLGVKGDLEADRCIIQEVVPDSPAAKGGLMANDIVLKFAGDKVGRYEELRGLIRKKKPGEEVTVEILRGEQTVTLKIKLGRQ